MADYACEAHSWIQLEVITPLFEIINAIVTFLEGDGALLCHVSISFLVISESLTLLILPPAIAVTTKKAFVKRYSTIASPLHALAVVLDPAVSKSHREALSFLYTDCTFSNSACVAMAKCCQWLDMDDATTKEAARQFIMALPDTGAVMSRCSEQSSACHPQLWWLVDGCATAKMISPIASAVFSSYPSSGGNERSFKAGSRKHNRTRSHLGGDRTDRQSFCAFNSAQLERVNTVLSVKQASLIELCMLRGVESEGRRFLRKVGTFVPDEAEDCDPSPASDVCNVIIGA